MPTRYNMWYNRIRMSHRLRRADTVEIMRLGGVDVSSSRVDGWQRRQTDVSRRTIMTESEFDAFTNGLAIFFADRSPRDVTE